MVRIGVFIYLALLIIHGQGFSQSRIVFEKDSKELIIELTYAFLQDYKAAKGHDFNSDENEGMQKYKANYVDRIRSQERFTYKLKDIQSFLAQNSWGSVSRTLFESLINNREQLLLTEDYRLIEITNNVPLKNNNANKYWNEVLENYQNKINTSADQPIAEPEEDTKEDKGEGADEEAPPNPKRGSDRNRSQKREEPVMVENNGWIGNLFLYLVIAFISFYSYHSYLKKAFRNILDADEEGSKVERYKNLSGRTGLTAILDGLNERKESLKEERNDLQSELAALRERKRELTERVDFLEIKLEKERNKKNKKEKNKHKPRFPDYPESTLSDQDYIQKKGNSYEPGTEVNFPVNPIPEKPKLKLYFGIPNPGGNFYIPHGKLDKMGVVYYKIEWKEGENRGEISYIGEGGLNRRAISSLDESLKPVCEIKNIELRDSAESISFLGSGKVFLQNDLWQVDSEQKVKIQLS